MGIIGSLYKGLKNLVRLYYDDGNTNRVGDLRRSNRRVRPVEIDWEAAGQPSVTYTSRGDSIKYPEPKYTYTIYPERLERAEARWSGRNYNDGNR